MLVPAVRNATLFFNEVPHFASSSSDSYRCCPGNLSKELRKTPRVAKLHESGTKSHDKIFVC